MKYYIKYGWIILLAMASLSKDQHIKLWNLKHTNLYHMDLISFQALQPSYFKYFFLKNILWLYLIKILILVSLSSFHPLFQSNNSTRPKSNKTLCYSWRRSLHVISFLWILTSFGYVSLSSVYKSLYNSDSFHFIYIYIYIICL